MTTTVAGSTGRDDDSLRSEVRAWLEATWDPERTVREWWELTVEAGWQFPHWPAGLGGRGLSMSETGSVYEEVARFGALGPPFGVAQTHGAPVVLQFGSEAQRRRLVPPVARGLESWCQLFSEPEAGSDLAGLRTRAVRDHGGWLVTGQKIWTSGAASADRAILLARSDPASPRHRGLSFFVIDMGQPGVQVRPIVQMNGAGDYFNETFLSEAWVPADDLIAAEGDGWRLARATLALERAMNVKVDGLVTAAAGERGGALDRACGEVVAEGERSVPYFRHRTYFRPDVLGGVARDRDRTDDPLVRHRLARLWSLDRVMHMGEARTRGGGSAAGAAGVDASLVKIGKSQLARQALDLASSLLGPAAALVGDDSYLGGAVAEMMLTVPSVSIAGGTDEIQRNVIAERGLGLPREPS